MTAYRAKLAAGGHAWGPEQMALMQPVHVGATSAPPRATRCGPGVMRYYKNLETIFSSLPDSYGDHLPRLKFIRETIADLPYEKFCRDQAVFGDAAEVVDRLQRAKRGVRAVPDHRLVRPGLDAAARRGRAHDARFAEQVMPKLG